MPGHIKLGAPGALYDYMIVNTDLYSKTPANQFAAKLATGAGNYDDLQNWSYWVMDDWQAGVGKKDAEAGGFLYSELETRYPGRLALPNAMKMTVIEDSETVPQNYGYQAGDIHPTTTLLVGSGSAIKRVAHALNGRNSSVLFVTLYLKNTATSHTAALYSSTTSGGNQIPNAQLAAQTFTPDGEPGYHYYHFEFAGTFTSGSYYHIVIYPTSSDAAISVPIRATVGSSANFSSYDGSTWSNYTGGAFVHGCHFNTQTPISHLVIFPATGYLYAAKGAVLVKKASVTSDWATVTTFGASITSMVVVGDELWIGLGNSTNYQVMDDAESLTAASVPAKLLALSNGYVYRAVAGDVYYTSDGSTWSSAVEITWAGHEVRGLAGLGDYMYCSTDDALHYIGYGDFIFSVTRWPSIAPTNGRGMVNHQGALFIPLQQSVVRYDGNSPMPMGPDRGEGLPGDRAGHVTGLYSLNNWLVATIVPTTSFGNKATAWAYNDQGWHYLGSLTRTNSFTGAMTYDYATRLLYFGASYGCVWQLPLSDSANFNDIDGDDIPRMPMGYIQQDWFFGGLKEVQKDFDSVYLTGDGISSDCYAEVYWMDDDSTDWELLGTVTSERRELRWSNYSVRPNSRQLKLLVALYSKTVGVSPIVRAVRLKYHPMVSDWYRWSFPILVSDNQQEMGWTVSSRTAQQKRDHLDEMTTRVPPFIFEDMDGKQYEVKVMGCQIQNMDVEWINGNQVFNSIYNMTIEAIRSGEYEG